MMKFAPLAIAMTVTAGPALAELDALAGNYWNEGGVVTVSCFRGPWELVYWDKPEGIFIDSLVNVGYDYPSALAIATRICREQALVGRPDLMKAEMERIIAEAPRP
jgi:hypothetical protein